MVRDAVLPPVVASSTPLHGFARLFPRQQMIKIELRISHSDSNERIIVYKAEIFINKSPHCS
jgi:hypothetical protein